MSWLLKSLGLGGAGGNDDAAAPGGETPAEVASPSPIDPEEARKKRLAKLRANMAAAEGSPASNSGATDGTSTNSAFEARAAAAPAPVPPADPSSSSSSSSSSAPVRLQHAAPPSLPHAADSKSGAIPAFQARPVVAPAAAASPSPPQRSPSPRASTTTVASTPASKAAAAPPPATPATPALPEDTVLLAKITGLPASFCSDEACYLAFAAGKAAATAAATSSPVKVSPLTLETVSEAIELKLSHDFILYADGKTPMRHLSPPGHLSGILWLVYCFNAAEEKRGLPIGLTPVGTKVIAEVQQLAVTYAASLILNYQYLYPLAQRAFNSAAVPASGRFATKTMREQHEKAATQWPRPFPVLAGIVLPLQDQAHPGAGAGAGAGVGGAGAASSSPHVEPLAWPDDADPMVRTLQAACLWSILAAAAGCGNQALLLPFPSAKAGYSVPSSASSGMALDDSSGSGDGSDENRAYPYYPEDTLKPNGIFIERLVQLIDEQESSLYNMSIRSNGKQPMPLVAQTLASGFSLLIEGVFSSRSFDPATGEPSFTASDRLDLTRMLTLCNIPSIARHLALGPLVTPTNVKKHLEFRNIAGDTYRAFALAGSRRDDDLFSSGLPLLTGEVASDSKVPLSYDALRSGVGSSYRHYLIGALLSASPLVPSDPWSDSQGGGLQRSFYAKQFDDIINHDQGGGGGRGRSFNPSAFNNLTLTLRAPLEGLWIMAHQAIQGLLRETPMAKGGRAHTLAFLHRQLQLNADMMKSNSAGHDLMPDGAMINLTAVLARLAEPIWHGSKCIGEYSPTSSSSSSSSSSSPGGVLTDKVAALEIKAVFSQPAFKSPLDFRKQGAGAGGNQQQQMFAALIARTRPVEATNAALAQNEVNTSRVGLPHLMPLLDAERFAVQSAAAPARPSSDDAWRQALEEEKAGKLELWSLHGTHYRALPSSDMLVVAAGSIKPITQLAFLALSSLQLALAKSARLRKLENRIIGQNLHRERSFGDAAPPGFSRDLTFRMANGQGLDVLRLHPGLLQPVGRICALGCEIVTRSLLGLYESDADHSSSNALASAGAGAASPDALRASSSAPGVVSLSSVDWDALSSPDFEPPTAATLIPDSLVAAIIEVLVHIGTSYDALGRSYYLTLGSGGQGGGGGGGGGNQPCVIGATTSLLDKELNSILHFALSLLICPISKVASSPHLRAKLGDLLYTLFVPPKTREEEGESNGLGNYSAAALAACPRILLYPSPFVAKNLVPALLTLFGTVEATGHYEKIEHRAEVTKLLNYLYSVPGAPYRACFASLPVGFAEFANGLLNQSGSLLTEGIDSLQTIHTINKQKRDIVDPPEPIVAAPHAPSPAAVASPSPVPAAGAGSSAGPATPGGHEAPRRPPALKPWSQLTEAEKTERENQLADATNAARSGFALVNETTALLERLVEEDSIAEAFLSPELVDRLALMLNNLILTLAGKKGVSLKVDNMASLNFYPIALLRSALFATLRLAKRSGFVKAVAESKLYSMKKDELDKADGVIRRLNVLPENTNNNAATSAAGGEPAGAAAAGVGAESSDSSSGLKKDSPSFADWLAFREAVSAAELEAEEADEMYADPPDEFVDFISSGIFEEPLITPWGQAYEKTSIIQSLLQKPECPMTRRPLKKEDLKPATELKARIEAWKKEKRAAWVEAKKNGTKPAPVATPLPPAPAPAPAPAPVPVPVPVPAPAPVAVASASSPAMPEEDNEVAEEEDADLAEAIRLSMAEGQ